MSLPTLKPILVVAFVLAVAVGRAGADTVILFLGADGDGRPAIDQTIPGAYDGCPSGLLPNTGDPSPGCRAAASDYESRWQSSGDPADQYGPLADPSSRNRNGSLKVDYFALSGTPMSTVRSQGPIQQGTVSTIEEWYENRTGYQAGQNGPSAAFEEQPDDEPYIPSGDSSGVPQPSSLLRIGGLGAFCLLLVVWSYSGTEEPITAPDSGYVSVAHAGVDRRRRGADQPRLHWLSDPALRILQEHKRDAVLLKYRFPGQDQRAVLRFQ